MYVEDSLRDQKILIHKYGEKSLIREYIRVTTGSRKVMERFLEAFFEVDGGLGSS